MNKHLTTMPNEERIIKLHASIAHLEAALADCTNMQVLGDLVDLRCEYIHALEDMGVDVEQYADPCWTWQDAQMDNVTGWDVLLGEDY